MTEPVDDAMPKSAYDLLLAMTPERRARAILELKRRQEARDAGRPATFKRPKRGHDSSTRVESDSTPEPPAPAPHL